MKTRFVLLIFFVWLFFPKKVLAVSISIDSSPSTISKQEFLVKFTVKGAKSATNYFRVLLYKEGKQDYFSQTWNGKDWYEKSEGKQYFPLEVHASTSGELRGRVIKAENGNYLLSVKRYTASGNAADDSAASVNVTVNLPQEGSTPVPTPTITASPTPKVVAVTVETVEPEVTFEPQPVSTVAGSVLGTEEVRLEPQAEEDQTSAESFLMPAVLALVGVLCIVMGVFGIIKAYFNGQKTHFSVPSS